MSLGELPLPWSVASESDVELGYSVPLHNGLCKEYNPYSFYWIRRFSNVKDSEMILSISNGEETDMDITLENKDQVLKNGKLVQEESRGKSGATFFYSEDKTILFKELRNFEFKQLNSMLTDYIKHINKFPSTFLCRFVGCFSTYDMGSGEKRYYICIKALFDIEAVTQVYDLKGSTHKRTAGAKKMSKHVILKDLDALENKLRIQLGRQLKTAFELQMKADVNFLQEKGVIDYSFLIGLLDLHFTRKKKGSDSHKASLKEVFWVGKKHRGGRTREQHESHVREMIRRIHERTGNGKKKTVKSPVLRNKFQSIWTAEAMVGIRARQNDGTPTADAKVYYFGIIDFLQPYGVLKKMETAMKGIAHDKTTISCAHPDFYSSRFLKFVGCFLE